MMLPLALAFIALLYASVGHGGGSGYIAVLTLSGLSPEQVRPIALMLNILVASLGTWQFARRGHISTHLLLRVGLPAAPAAALGGAITLPTPALRVALGGVLLLASARLLWPLTTPRTAQRPRTAPLVGTGAALGLFAGLTGTGGGIFLTPVLLFTGWASPKVAAGVSVAFILINSVFGLGAFVASGGAIPAIGWTTLLPVGIGGLIGAHLGSHHLSPTHIKRALAAVLLIASVKLLAALGA